tara:strand:+ start:199 stop:387 length:189 start_codon:yes stop_codon:yes gene_type:complete
MAKGFVYMVWNGQHFIGEIDNDNLKKLLTEEEYSKVANNTKTKFLLDLDKLQQYVKQPKYKY